MTADHSLALDTVDSKSSAFEKLAPDLRRCVNQALFDRRRAWGSL